MKRPLTSNHARAGKLFAETVKLAQVLDKPAERVAALGEIARAQVKMGLLAEAAATARGIETAANRAESLSMVAEAHVTAQAEQARRTFAEAIVAARQIPRGGDADPNENEPARDASLSAIALAEWNAEFRAEALAAAATIEDPCTKATTLARLAGAKAVEEKKEQGPAEVP